jgi:hypothetical protein
MVLIVSWIRRAGRRLWQGSFTAQRLSQAHVFGQSRTQPQPDGVDFNVKDILSNRMPE